MQSDDDAAADARDSVAALGKRAKRNEATLWPLYVLMVLMFLCMGGLYVLVKPTARQTTRDAIPQVKTEVKKDAKKETQRVAKKETAKAVKPITDRVERVRDRVRVIDNTVTKIVEGKGPTRSQLNAALVRIGPAAFDRYCTANPDRCKGQPGQDAIPLTRDDLTAAIETYCAKADCVKKGDKGDDGKDATQEQVDTAVTQFLPDSVAALLPAEVARQFPDQLATLCAANNGCRGADGANGTNGTNGTDAVTPTQFVYPDGFDPTAAHTCTGRPDAPSIFDCANTPPP